MNREHWLTEVAKRVEPLFKGYKLAPYRLTCGWPSNMAIGRRYRRVGECHSPTISRGGTHEIFISPLLEDSLNVAGTVCHELAHVAVGVDLGHGRDFVRVCEYVGLTDGKPTEVMPGPMLMTRLKKIIKDLGEYPHKAIVPIPAQAKASGTVSLRCVECGCRLTMTVKWVDEVGLPTCACGGSFDVATKKRKE